jgi:hypothetical protein
VGAVRPSLGGGQMLFHDRGLEIRRVDGDSLLPPGENLEAIIQGTRY